MGLLCAVAIVALLRTRMAAEGACTLARRHLPEVLGLEVGVGQCEVDPLTQEVRLRGLSLFTPGHSTPLLAADRATVRLGAVRPLLGGLTLDTVELDKPRVVLDLSRTEAGAGEEGACPLDVLERLDLGRLEVKGGRVEVALPQGRRVELEGLDVAWRMRRALAEVQVRAARGAVRLTPGGQSLALHPLVLESTLSVEEGTLEVARAEVGLDEALLTLSGRVEDLCAPRLALEAQLYTPLATVGRAAGWSLPLSGHAWTRLSVNGPATDADVRAEVSAHGLHAGSYAPGDFTARLGLRGRTLTLEELLVRAGAGEARVHGTLQLTSGLPVRLELQATDASFGRILERVGLAGAWVDFPATGRITLGGTLSPSLQLGGEVSLRTGRFTLASRAFDAPPTAGGRTILTFASGRVHAGVRLWKDRAEFLGAVVESERSRARGDVTLHYAKERGLEVAGTVETDLSDFGAIAQLPWKGQGSARFSVKGPYSDVRAEADVSLRDFVFWDFALGVVQGRLDYTGDVLRFPALSGQKGRTQFHGGLALDFSGDGSVQGQVSLPKGRTEDLVDMLAPLHRSVAFFQGELAGEVEASARVEGPLDTFAGQVALTLRDTRLRERRLGDGVASLRFVDGNALVLEKARLEGPVGRTSAEGTWTWDSDALDFRFRGEGLSLSELVGPERAARSGVAGTLELSGKVRGDTNVPLVQGWLRSPQVTFAGRSLGAMLLEGRMEGRQAELFGRPFQDAHGSVRVQLSGDWPFQGNLTLALPEIRPLLPSGAIAQGVSGSLSGVVELAGEVFAPERLRLSATVDRLALARGDFQGRNEGDILLAWAQDRLTVQPFTFRGPGTELRGAGLLSEHLLEARLEGRLDMRLLESFVPGLERTGGRVQLSTLLRGSLARPLLTGSADLVGVQLSFRDWPLSLRGVEGRVAFDDRRVRLESLRGRLNEGLLSASGEVALKGFRPADFALHAELERVGVRLADDVSFHTTGQLALVGPAELPTLSGNLEVLRLRYTRGLELEELLRDVAQAQGAVTQGGRPREFARLNLGMQLEDVRVENNLARARLVGQVRLTGTNARPSVVGSVQVAEGGQAFFRGNEFTITQGVLEFSERDAFDPVLDLRAQTAVSQTVWVGQEGTSAGGEPLGTRERIEYQVRLHAFGRARQPQVLLSSDPGLPEGDIVSLLTLGFTSRNQSSTASTGAGLAAEALFSVTGLDRQVQRLLPNTPLLRDTDVQVSTLYNPVSRLVEPMLQVESTFLTDKLRLHLTQPVLSSAVRNPDGRGNGGTRVQAEYKVDRNVSAQVQWDNQNAADGSLGNPGVELKWNWEVE